MTPYVKWSTAACTAVLLAACARNMGMPAQQPSANVGTMSGASSSWTATLNPVGGSNITGTATVTGDASESHATLNLSGATPGDSHPWHIHTGPCGKGPVVGPGSAYTPLQVGSNGTASGSASIPVGLDPAGTYHVNVHKSSSEMGTIVACGDLRHNGS